MGRHGAVQQPRGGEGGGTPRSCHIRLALGPPLALTTARWIETSGDPREAGRIYTNKLRTLSEQATLAYNTAAYTTRIVHVHVQQSTEADERSHTTAGSPRASERNEAKRAKANANAKRAEQ